MFKDELPSALEVDNVVTIKNAERFCSAFSYLQQRLHMLTGDKAR
jgi:hypothetical protein